MMRSIAVQPSDMETLLIICTAIAGFVWWWCRGEDFPFAFFSFFVGRYPALMYCALAGLTGAYSSPERAR